MLLACKHARHAEDPSYANQSVSRMFATAFCIRNLGHCSQYILVVTCMFTQQDEFKFFFCSIKSSLQQTRRNPKLLNLNNEEELRYTWPSNTRQRLLQWTPLFMNISKQFGIKPQTKNKEKIMPPILTRLVDKDITELFEET